MQANRSKTEAAALSAREVAALLGVSARHVSNLAARGVLPQPVRLGRSVRWLRAEVEAALAKLRDGGAR